jgi:hypothetical protein
VEQLEALCAQPNRLQRPKEIRMGETTLTEEHMQQLQKLTGLTALEPDVLQPSCLPLLSSFPALQRLHLSSWSGEFGAEGLLFWGEDEWEHLASALEACPQLTHVSLLVAHGSAEELEELVLAVPHLRKLRVVGEYIDLPFLEYESELEELELNSCSFDPSELTVLLKLPRLRRLELSECVRLDPFSLALLEPPSLLLPQLHTFVYEESE